MRIEGQANVWAMQKSHSKEALAVAMKVAIVNCNQLLGLLSPLLRLSNGI